MYKTFSPHFLILILTLFLGGITATARATTWYVDRSAVGTADGTSRANAWTAMAAIIQTSLSGGDVVLVYPGTYDERFTLTQSGTSATARITYKGVGFPVLRGIHDQYDHGGVNNIAIIGFEITQLSSANNYAAITLAGDTGWLIRDNYIHDTYGAGIDGRVNTLNSNNIIRANTLDNISGIGQGINNSIAITMTGNSNLIEYNSIAKSLDRIQAFGVGDVIRNNFFGATDTSLYPNSSPYPYHNDGFQSFDTANPLSKLLCERNWDTDNKDSVGGTNGHGYTIQNYGTPGLLNWMIFRFNVVVRSGGAAFIFRDIDNIYVYNMTCVGIEDGASSPFQNGVGYNSGPIGDGQDWRNNTWSYSPNTLDYSGIFPTVNRPTNSGFNYEHTYNAGILPIALQNVPSVDPLFTDRASDLYTLMPASVLRGAGGPITTALNSGANSTIVIVAEPKRLFDGWGIADADFIKVGSGSYVQISSIDYDTGAVTLSSPISWSDGEPVVVKGTEDVGALPFSYATPFAIKNTTSANISAGSAILSATVSNSDAVRKVEFLVDGIPVGESYAAPYSVNWTADGNPHAIEARAYNAWASKTLSVSSFATDLGVGTQLLSQGPATGSAVETTTSVTEQIQPPTVTPSTVLNSSPVVITPSGPSVSISSSARLLNLSARARTGSGANTLIAGFVISGSSKTILVRGIGPTLAQLGLAGALSDPQLSLFSGSTQIQSNSSWGGGSTLTAAFARVGAFALPSTSDDDAILSTLQGGAYTARVTSVSASTGISLVEIYDADPDNLSSDSRLINISARANVGTGANVIIAGFVVGGTGSERVLIRAIGPSLAGFGVSGVLSTPQLTLSNSDGKQVASNSVWGGTAALASAFAQVGAFPLPLTSSDSALLVTLVPGTYTAEVSGLNGTTGNALVEVFEAP